MRTGARISSDDLNAICAALRTSPNGERLARTLRESLSVERERVLELHLRLLGGFKVKVGERWENGPPPMRGGHLIAYLALHRAQASPKSRLIDALFPDCDGDSANHRLHIAVSGARAFLRTALGGVDAIAPGHGAYGLHSDIAVKCDVEAFLGATEGETPEELLRAKELYTGELLAGEHADWIEPIRVRCASVYVGVLERLAEHATSQGEYGDALAVGLELLAFDRGHEGASRLVMRCFAALGRRGRALAEYEALRAHLRKHLGLEPAAETRQLIRAIVETPEPSSLPQRS